MKITNKDDLLFEVNINDGTAMIIKSPNAKGTISLPVSISHEYIITKIKEGSFKNNKNIRSINTPNDSLLYSIGEEAFSYSSLETMSISSKLKEIGERAFSWCDKLKTIDISENSSLCLIEKEAFSHSSIETFSIPFKLTEIKEFTFSHCEKLKSIKIPENSLLRSIRKFAFSCSSIERIFIPSKVEKLEEGWCAGTNKLNHISVSNNNQYFINYEDKYILSKTNKNDTEYDQLIFTIRNIEEANLPEHIKSIKTYSFSCCNNLRTINIPTNSSLQFIDKEAFSFSSIEKISIPSKVTTIDDGAFSYCKCLKTVDIPEDSSLSSINKGTFSSSSITSINIPLNVTEIKEGAFSYCENLKSIKIPENSLLRSIRKFAFSCSSIERIFIPSKVEKLEEGWCAGTNKLNHISVSNNNQYFINYEDKFILSKTNKNDTEYDQLIFTIRNIEEANLPEHIKSIKTYSFSCCNNLRTINIPTNSSLQFIESNAFESSSLEFISIPPQVKEIGENAFSHCSNLETVCFSENSILKIINKEVFSYSSIEYITIPPNVTNICENAFLECKKLKTVKFAANTSLNFIHKEAFHGTSLEILSFQSSLMKILREVIKHQKIPNLEIIDDEVHFNSWFKLQNITSISFPNAHQVTIEKGCGKYSLFILRDCNIIGDESAIKEHDVKFITPKKETKIEIIDAETIDRLIQSNDLINESSFSQIYKIKLNTDPNNKKGSKTPKKGKKTKKIRESKKVKSSSKDVRALKVFNKQFDLDQMDQFISELNILNNLDNQNIIKSFGFFYGDEERSPCILEEYFKSNLENSIKQLKDIDLIAIIYEISSAMKEIHRKRIFHRNLKPTNILLDLKNHAKICDFSISSSNELQTQGSKSFLYIAPEAIQDHELYSEKIDVYSFGVLLIFILTKGEHPDDVVGDQKVTIPKNINKVSKSLIEKCLSTSPKDRPSFFQIVDFIIKNQFKLIDGIENDISSLRQFLGFSKDDFLPIQ